MFTDVSVKAETAERKLNKVGKKVKFNGMDLFIIIVLVLVIAAGAFLLFGSNGTVVKNASENKTEVTFMVELTARDEEFTKLIEIGDVVLVGEKEKAEAVVTDIDISTAASTGYDILGGRVLQSELPGEYDVKVTLKGEGVETEEYIKHGMTELRVGQGVALSNKKWTGYGFILAVDDEA